MVQGAAHAYIIIVIIIINIQHIVAGVVLGGGDQRVRTVVASAVHARRQAADV